MAHAILKCFAFLRRDWLTETSYKLNFLLRIFRILGMLITFYFLGKLVPDNATAELAKFGGDFFEFIVIGLGMSGFFTTTLKLYSESIRTSQMTGCLEAMISTQTDPVPIVLMSSIFGILWSSMMLIVLMLVAILLFGLDLGQANLPAALLVFLLATMAFISFGVISAAVIVWLKKGDPITWLFTNLGSIIGGAFFPLDVMPVWLQKVALVIPLTHALEAMRMTLLQGAPLAEVKESTIILGLMAFVLFPLSLWLFKIAVATAKREGTLMQY